MEKRGLGGFFQSCDSGRLGHPPPTHGHLLKNPPVPGATASAHHLWHYSTGRWHTMAVTCHGTHPTWEIFSLWHLVFLKWGMLEVPGQKDWPLISQLKVTTQLCAARPAGLQGMPVRPQLVVTTSKGRVLLTRLRPCQVSYFQVKSSQTAARKSLPKAFFCSDKAVVCGPGQALLNGPAQPHTGLPCLAPLRQPPANSRQWYHPIPSLTQWISLGLAYFSYSILGERHFCRQKFREQWDTNM